MDKQFEKEKQFLYKKGRVYFFSIPDPIQRINFFQQTTSMLTKIGYEYQVLEKHEYEI